MLYFNLIFTLHAQQQLAARGIKMEDAYETFKHSTTVYKGKYGKTTQFQREFDNFKITVVAHQNQKNEWVARSVWRNPPLPGTSDAKQKESWKKYNKANFLGKIWLSIKQQLNI